MSMAAPVAQRERGAGTAVLASQRDEHVVAVDRAAPFEREQGRVQRRVADLPAGQYAAAGDVLHQLRIGLVPGGQVGEPQLPALVVMTTMPSKVSSRCSRKLVSRLAYRSLALLTSVRRVISASPSSSSSRTSSSSARERTRSRLRSVSPMYLLTTAARSTR